MDMMRFLREHHNQLGGALGGSDLNQHPSVFRILVGHEILKVFCVTGVCLMTVKEAFELKVSVCQ